MFVFLNLLWIFLGGGILIFFFYLVGSISLMRSPTQHIKLAALSISPFGKAVEQEATQNTKA